MPKANTIVGVTFTRTKDYALCHVDKLSDELKDIIRRNISTICHGSYITDYANAPIFSYGATLSSFLERYEKKPDLTKKGMIGEFLAHILITELFTEFDIASAYFNLEEKSIKKGFDLLLYNTEKLTLWITEVKSGNLHKDKSHDDTTLDLLKTAVADLNDRLNKSEQMYWLNSINSVRASLNNNKDYKKALVEILVDKGGAAIKNVSTSNDMQVLLVTNLFEPLATKITDFAPKKYLSTLSKSNKFSESIMFCIQKETYLSVVDFLRDEAIKAK